MIVLDTNVLSELTKSNAEGAVVAWANSQTFGDLYTTAITEAEVLFGLALMPQGGRRDRLVRSFTALFSVLLGERVLPFDRRSARAYADLAAERRGQGGLASGSDVQIAAIARAHGARVIATRNTRHFAGCGVAVVDPWTAGVRG